MTSAARPRRWARVVAGVDEAGLGPLLGPFAIGFSAFRLPVTGADLTTRLAPAASPEPRPRDGRLVVADSKRVFDRTAAGLQRLESTALAFLALLDPFGRVPASPSALLSAPPESLRTDSAVLGAHPWYSALPAALPHTADAARVTAAAERLAVAARAGRVELLAGGVRLVPEGELNASFARTGSKAQSLWEETAGVLRYLWRAFGAEGCVAWVDRQGARKRHAALLGEACAPGAVRVLVETDECSSYRVEDGDRRLEVHFATGAEERSLPTALASCFAKYGRELAMQGFNAWFGALQADLVPTAGYVTDARRWLSDAGPALARAGLTRERLMRAR